MNPPTDELALPSQPNRLSTSCDLHPDEHFSGFCPSCLCDRLSVLDHNGVPPPPSSSSRKPPTISTASLKALFKPTSNGINNKNVNGRVLPGFFPELRRTKSFSAKNTEGFSGRVEPQRRSCDVRLREDHRNLPTTEVATFVVAGGRIEDEARPSSVSEPVLEITEEAEIEEEEVETEILKCSGEIREEKTCEIVEEEENMKPMKDYMDLYSQTKKPSVKDFAGTFFSAASVFSKKLQKWRQKQNAKKPRNNGDGGGQPQSEIGYGRRSSETDPRFSLDAGRFSVDIGRISLDDARNSIDEPRASWDGHLIGRATTARVPPPPSMLSVVENAPMYRSDMQIPVDEPYSPSINPINGESDPIIIIPGGSNQTRDYYTEPPSSRRRKSIDRSNSIRKTVTPEIDDVKSVSNSKVSPATTIVANSMQTMEDKGNQNGDKKSRRWGKWSILGFIYRKGVNKDDEEEDRYSRSNSAGMVERSLSESWSELRNGEGGGPRMRRSNSNVSWRSSGGGSTRNKSWRQSPKDGENGMLRFYLTPMRSSWRTSGGGSGGGGSGWEKTAARANSHGHSIARRVMRLY